MKRIAMVVVIAAICAISARGQNFQNLNFESVQNLLGNPGNGTFVNVTNGLPDWNAYSGTPNGGDPLSEIYYVSNYLGGVGAPVELEGGTNALSGSFCVGLYEFSSISQTGVIPDNAATLEFEATIPDNNLKVTLGGQTLSYSEISASSNYYVYSANIQTGMDGQTEVLAFIDQNPGSGILIDNIEFQPIPEPSEYALTGVGLVVFGFWRWRQQALG